MAEVLVEGDRLVVRLSGRERLAALHGDVTVPLSAVTAAEVFSEPFAAVHGVRAPGLGLPGIAAIGTWRHRAGKDFVVVRRGRPAVRIALDGAAYDALVVSCSDPAAVVARLTSAGAATG